MGGQTYHQRISNWNMILESNCLGLKTKIFQKTFVSIFNLSYTARPHVLERNKYACSMMNLEDFNDDSRYMIR